MEPEKKTAFSIWPTDAELEYFKTNTISPGEFFHQAFLWMVNGEKYGWVKEVSTYLLITLLGLGFFAISYFTIVLFAKILLILLSFFATCYGTLAILMEWRKHGKSVYHTATRV